MSVIKMKASDGEASPLSGGGMDRVVEKKGLSKRVKLGIGGALLLVAATSFYTMAPDASSQTVAADRASGIPPASGSPPRRWSRRGRNWRRAG